MPIAKLLKVVLSIACFSLVLVGIERVDVLGWRLAIAVAQTSETIDSEAERPIELIEAANGTIQPVTLQDTLERDDASASDSDRYYYEGQTYNRYTVQGVAGQAIAIDLSSREFDPVLGLRLGRESIARNDDRDSPNSHIAITLPVTGTYTISISSSKFPWTGSYTLSLRSATPAELTRSAALTEADRLLMDGNIYRQTPLYQTALQSLEQALTIYRSQGDRNAEASALRTLGLTYAAMSQEQQASGLQESQQAIASYEQAISLYRAVGNRNGEADALLSLGFHFFLLGQSQQAIASYQQARVNYQAAGDRQGEAESLNFTGLAYSALREYQQAVDYFEQALVLYQAVGAHGGEADVRSSLVNARINLSTQR